MGKCKLYDDDKMWNKCKREHIDKQEFTFIELFNNQELLTILGTSISDIAEMGLREIAKTVASLQKSEKLKNRTIENINKEIILMTIK